jgi:cytochrome b561
MKNKKWIIAIIIIFILTIYVVMSRPQDDGTLMAKLISKHINTDQSIIILNIVICWR